MAGLKETEKWENEIYRIEENDPVHGGEDGISNKPIKQLANRTKYLKTEVEKRYIAQDASTTQKGLVQLDSSTDSNDEDKAATPKAVNAVKALVTAVRNALNNYIPNSKKSDADNSTSSDTIATSYAVKKVRDIVENRFSSLANADGYKHVGRCKSVEMLRKVVPSKHGQRILLDAYYEGGTTGGGEFVADLQDLTTADDGGSCFVVLNNTAR
ncbi:TPA: phage tail protein, partial [Pasteurella multocida]